MASLNVRKLDDEIYEQLRMRATRHGVSMEEETRQIITQAMTTSEKISDVFIRHFGKKNGVNLDAIVKRQPHNPMDFSE